MKKMLYKLATWLIKHKRHVVICDNEGTPYLTRIYLVGSASSPGALLMHWMHRPDASRCHHNHPWHFITLVLAGGYIEEVSDRYPGSYDPEFMSEKLLRPGTIHYRRATYTHRVAGLPAGEALTLVIRSPKCQSWGFWTQKAGLPTWVGWKPFLEQAKQGVAWCEDLIKSKS